MPKKKPTAKIKLRPDMNETAHRVMLEATGQAPKTLPPGARTDKEKNPQAVERGRKGGRTGGEARAARLTPDARSEIARKAARARWEESDTD